MPTPAVTIRAASRISAFQSHVNSHAAVIRAAGLAAWKNVTATGEIPRVLEYLTKQDCGTDYLNKNLAKALSIGGRAVKFASIFLHAKPKVFGWRKQPITPTKGMTGSCELGDLQTLFLYVDSKKILCQARSVIFQAKNHPNKLDYVIATTTQRELYDHCDGFTYESLCDRESRKLPSGHLRVRALQYLFVAESPVSARTIPADIGAGAFVDFGEHLFRFLDDSTGLEVAGESRRQRGWNRIVWDMINYVAKETVAERAKKTLGKSKSRKRAGHLLNSGLKELLNYFNGFEDHDNYSLKSSGGNPQEAEGFGLQFVIVWDGGLNLEEEIPIAPLCELEDYATAYLALPALADPKRREQLAGEIATRISDNSGLRDQIVKSVQTSVSDALIVALCIAIGEKSVRKDSKRLRDLAGKAQSDTARSHIVCALKEVFDQHKPDHTECAKVLKLLKAYPDSPKICELREALKRLSISQSTEEQIPEEQILNIEGC